MNLYKIVNKEQMHVCREEKNYFQHEAHGNPCILVVTFAVMKYSYHGKYIFSQAPKI